MLHGREAERASLAAVVDGAREGRAGALVLHGEPGSGKTALLDDVVVGAGGLRVLRVQGLESESPIAFGALHRLLRPVLGRLDGLPHPQARALGIALGQRDGGRADPFLVGLATLSVLTDAADDLPVLVVVDDAHWLDPASADALLFAARRLGADHLALLFAVRDDAARTVAHDGVPSLRVGPLDETAARSLLRESTGADVADDVADLLLRRSGGNALALVELCTALSPGQLAGAEPTPPHLPLTADLERVFLDRARRLPPQVQSFLLLVAADDSGRIGTVRRAAALLGLDESVAGAAEASGLVVADGDHLRVRHPLVRSAIYQAATGSDRRAAHRALAASLDGRGEPDRQAWHGAAAAEGPDEALAATLADAGARAEMHGGFVSAADAYERAAELTIDVETRAARCFAAARNAWACAQPARARALATAARDQTHDPRLRADVERLRGRIEVNVGSAAVAHRIFVAAAVASAEVAPERALDLAVAASGLAAYGGDSGTPLPPGAIGAGPVADDDPATATARRLLVAMTAATQGDWPAALAGLREAVDGAPADAPPDLLAHLGQAALHIGDDLAAQRCFTAMLGAAREAGAGMTVLYALPRLAFPLLVQGQWSAARALADEARALSAGAGQGALSATPVAVLALLAAHRGDEVHDELIIELDDLMERHPLGILSGPTQDLRRWAVGTRAGHAGDAGAALHQLARMEVPALTRMAAVDRIDAAVRAGDRERAEAWVEELVPVAEGTRWPWADGVVDHGRALLASGEDATRLYESAVAHFERAGRPFDLARAHLAFGEHLRRSQRRVEARPRLRRALEIFEDLRAEPLRTRAARELRASGETARKRDVSTLVRLTPMELQVAQLVSQGLSNKEVAARCWVSPRTVAFHLRNCFAKTGVASRGELAQLDLS
ncbi:AAA family ATPase [Actinotalea sp.]|uniref:helix-turn-helix transcriptional regulator n=1 Tax=Actinotalea sp. TaxID=1872145 RepID=UPI003561CE45